MSLLSLPSSPSYSASPAKSPSSTRSPSLWTSRVDHGDSGSALTGARNSFPISPGPSLSLSNDPRIQITDPDEGISFLGSVSLLFSSMTGPGLVTIPLLFQQAGWLTPILALLIGSILSSCASLFTIQALTMIPGNSHFEAKLEFSSLLETFLGPKLRRLAHLWLYLSIQSTNLASIVISAQSMDHILLSLFSSSCAIDFTHGWVCIHPGPDLDKGENSPFGDRYLLASAGYLLSATIVLPLSLLNLVDNIKTQVISLISLIIIVIIWLILFLLHGLHPQYMPPLGLDHSQVLGTIIFNYVYMTTIPSWVNAKKPSVSIRKSIFLSTLIATLVYVLIGCFGALSYPMPLQSNILTIIGNGGHGAIIARITAFIFPIATIITSIPVYTIVVRYNLVRGGICGPRMANVLAAVVPWAIAIPFQTGPWFNHIVNWSSLLFAAVINFSLPFALYLIGRRRQRKQEIKGSSRISGSIKNLRDDSRHTSRSRASALNEPSIIYQEGLGSSMQDDRSMADKRNPSPSTFIPPLIITTDNAPSDLGDSFLVSEMDNLWPGKGNAHYPSKGGRRGLSTDPSQKPTKALQLLNHTSQSAPERRNKVSHSMQPVLEEDQGISQSPSNASPSNPLVGQCYLSGSTTEDQTPGLFSVMGAPGKGKKQESSSMDSSSFHLPYPLLEQTQGFSEDASHPKTTSSSSSWRDALLVPLSRIAPGSLTAQQSTNREPPSSHQDYLSPSAHHHPVMITPTPPRPVFYAFPERYIPQWIALGGFILTKIMLIFMITYNILQWTGLLGLEKK